MEIKRVENRKICAECGGICCKATPCSHGPSDFGESHDEIMANIEIALTENGIYLASYRYQPKYLVRTRGELDRAYSADLPGRRRHPDNWNRCIHLDTETGCTFSLQDRPLGGALYKPKGRRVDGRFVNACGFGRNAKEFLSWEEYQDDLYKLAQMVLKYNR
ncbi:MAG: hypothetical protein LBL08_03055 [Candidatus Nomurabacteria bacterium]|jgi:Fe-S-cluster containining protein|nr:hypothetical protein [Candidatus Nomurabacteria bacterium]